MLALCHSSLLKSSEAHTDATMRLIYEAMLDLQKEQQRVQEFGAKVDRISCKPVSPLDLRISILT